MTKRIDNVVVSLTSKEDCERLAVVEFASFEADETSVIARLLFPPANHSVMEQRIQRRTQLLCEEIEDGKRKIVKATIGDVIVGYAEWTPPGIDDTSVTPGDTFMYRFKGQVNRTRELVLGDTRYWYLGMLVVDPAYWGKGVGRSLVQWGIDESHKDPSGPTDSFLEASIMGEPFYCKLGYETLGWDSINDKDAPDGVCKWPYMIRRGRST